MSEWVAGEQRVEWLHEFDNARESAQTALESMDYLANALYAVGNDGLANRLSEYASVISESIKTMNSAVSRMITEQVNESLHQVGKTLAAIAEARG